MDAKREFIDMQLQGLRLVYITYHQLMDAFVSKTTMPHSRAHIRRNADEGLDRYFQGIEVLASFQQMMGLWKIDGPEEPKRSVPAIEDKSVRIIPIKVVRPPDDPDDKREAA